MPRTINAYQGVFVNMDKVREDAFKRAAKGEITEIHYHPHSEPCGEHKHESVAPKEVADDV